LNRIGLCLSNLKVHPCGHPLFRIRQPGKYKAGNTPERKRTKMIAGAC